MKAMYGLLAGIILVLLILLYVVYSNNQKNAHLKQKLRYMTGDTDIIESGIVVFQLPYYCVLLEERVGCVAVLECVGVCGSVFRMCGCVYVGVGVGWGSVCGGRCVIYTSSPV